MRGSGISWAECKSAPHSRQITMPAPHHSVFFTGWMPFLPPNQASKHRSEARYLKYHNQNKFPIKSKMYTKHYVKFCTKAFIWRKLQVLTSWSKSTFLDSPPTYKACNLWTKDNQILLFYAITSYTLLVNITIYSLIHCVLLLFISEMTAGVAWDAKCQRISRDNSTNNC